MNETNQELLIGACHVESSVTNCVGMDRVEVNARGNFIRAVLSLDGALKDYEKEWVPMLATARRFSYQSWKVSWDQLCQACGLDKFLPKVRS